MSILWISKNDWNKDGFQSKCMIAGHVLTAITGRLCRYQHFIPLGLGGAGGDRNYVTAM